MKFSKVNLVQSVSQHKLYHISPIEARDSILKDGLTPNEKGATFYFLVPPGASVELFAKAVACNQIFKREFSLFETELNLDDLIKDKCGEFIDEWQYIDIQNKTNKAVKHIGDMKWENPVHNIEVVKDIEANSDYELPSSLKHFLKFF